MRTGILFRLYLFFREIHDLQLTKSVPLGAKFQVRRSAWIQIFTEWFKHFLEIIKSFNKSLVLWILHGHYNYARNINVINLAQEDHVIIPSQSPYSTHKMQPLDKIFMLPMKTYYSEAVFVSGC